MSTTSVRRPPYRSRLRRPPHRLRRRRGVPSPTGPLPGIVLLAALLLGVAPLPVAAQVPAAQPAATPTEDRETAPVTEVASEAIDLGGLDLDRTLATDPSLTVGRLDNGLRYYVKRNATPADRASLWLVVDAGSTLETDDERGLAHFVEHMAFNGTRRFAEQELVDYLESVGMRFGPEINAFTGFDATTYTLQVPTDDPEILETAFRILEDWACCITFDPEEVDKERGVIIEEWRLGRGAEARILDQQIPTLFAGSRYAERLPIGLPRVIESAPAEALARFHRTWYRPELMAIIAVGDFDPATVEERIVDGFSRLENPENPEPRRLFPVPGHAEPLVAIATDPEMPSTRVEVVTKRPPPTYGTARAYRQSLVEQLFHALLNARFYEISERPDPPFAFAGSGTDLLVRTCGAHQLVAGSGVGQVERTLRALLAELERVERHGFTPGELERAKREMLRFYERAFRERETWNSEDYAAEYSRNFLEDETVPGIEREVELARTLVPTIRLEEIEALADDWSRTEDRVVLVSGPELDVDWVPDPDDLLEIFAETESRRLEPWTDTTPVGPLLDPIPEPGRVVAERRLDAEGGVAGTGDAIDAPADGATDGATDGASGEPDPDPGDDPALDLDGADAPVIEWRLSNGARVLIKSTDFREDQILVEAVSPGGHSLAGDKAWPSASLAAQVVSSGGLGELSEVDLNKRLAGETAGALPWIDELGEGLTALASPDDLELTLQLIHLTFVAPRVDEDAFQAWLDTTRPGLLSRLQRPEAAFFEALLGALTAGHPRRGPLTPSVVDRVDLATAAAFYRERFADASDFTFVFVGAVDPERLRPLAETYLASLPSLTRGETWRDVGARPPSEPVRLVMRRGLEPKSQVWINWSGEDEWTPEAAHDLEALAAALQIRLREVLREDLGGTYGASVGANFNRHPVGTWTLTIQFGCDPERAAELRDAALAEVAAFRAGEIPSLVAEKIREAEARRRELARQNNRYWVQRLADRALIEAQEEAEGSRNASDETGETGETDGDAVDPDDEGEPGRADDPALTERITPDTLASTARRRLDTVPTLIGVLYPEGFEGSGDWGIDGQVVELDPETRASGADKGRWSKEKEGTDDGEGDAGEGEATKGDKGAKGEGED